MAKISLTFPDKKKKSFRKGITGKEIAESIEKRALAIMVNDEVRDLGRKINKNAKIRVLTFKDKEGKQVFWHSSSHIMAEAVTRLFPKSRLTIGPPVEEGFYYDIDNPEPFTPEDMKRIEAEMKKIVKENKEFRRVKVTRRKALNLFKDNRYKKELIAEFKTLSVYYQGDWYDLCAGPQLPSTGYVKAFRLLKVAGAYWRGDQRNKQLQRIYGISFPDKKELKAWLKLRGEAEKRDHRKLGKQLNLFSFDNEAGPGFVFYHNKGTILFNKLIEFGREEQRKRGYIEVMTPHLLKNDLWRQSGHWDHYKENMYFTKIDEFDYGLKPMNCPCSILIYKKDIRSYRELPIRMAEFGLCHRHELSGVIAGLFRLRAFIQDDAHIYATPDQLKDEIINAIRMADHYYKVFGFTYHVELSTMPEKSILNKKQREDAENILKKALKEAKMDYTLNEGEGTFYGPKIDFHIKDSIGRTWQCATIQADYAMPDRFDITYVGKDGKEHRPIIIHRAIFGSIERFLGILIEHYAGKFPLWLSPEQVRILTVADRFNKYADEVKKKYFDAGINVTTDERAESISYKVREAQMNKINYILVVGEREKKNNTVTVRTENKVIGERKADAFLKQLLKEIEGKK